MPNMQPQNNTKNVLLFFVLSALTIGGYVLLQKWLQPPYVPPELQTVSNFIAKRALPPAVPGVGGLMQAVADAARVQYVVNRELKAPVLAEKVEAKPPPPPPKPVARS